MMLSTSWVHLTRIFRLPFEVPMLTKHYIAFGPVVQGPSKIDRLIAVYRLDWWLPFVSYNSTQQGTHSSCRRSEPDISSDIVRIFHPKIKTLLSSDFCKRNRPCPNLYQSSPRVPVPLRETETIIYPRYWQEGGRDFLSVRGIRTDMRRNLNGTASISKQRNGSDVIGQKTSGTRGNDWVSHRGWRARCYHSAPASTSRAHSLGKWIRTSYQYLRASRNGGGAGCGWMGELGQIGSVRSYFCSEGFE